MTRSTENADPIRTQLEAGLVAIPGVERRPSRHGDSESFFVGNREIAHFHGNQRMDVRLTKERIRERREERSLDARVTTRGPSAEWVAVAIVDARDIALALELVEDAVRANS